MVLLLAGQQGLFTSPRISDFTFAQEGWDGAEETTTDNITYESQPAAPQAPVAPSFDGAQETTTDTFTYPSSDSSTGGQAAPARPAAPTVVSGGGECINNRMHWVNTLSDGSRDVDPTANENCEGSGTDAQIVAAPSEADSQPAPTELATEPQPAEVDTTSQWECERALARGENICNDNITFCEATGWSGNNVVSAVLMMKHKGVCDPSHGERDSRGCIFEFTPLRAFNYSTPQAEGLFGAASACPAEGQPAQAAPAPAAPAAPVRTAQAAPAPVPAQGNVTINPVITNNPVFNNNPVNTNTNTNTNTSTNTITNNVTDRVLQREVVRAVPVTVGNVGIGTSVVYTQPVQYVSPQVLPKTGLPALAWSALAFIPTGFGLRRFSKVKKMLENHPSFIWEERQFKA